MRNFHQYWGYLVVVANLGVAFWGLLFVRKMNPAPPLFFPAALVAHIAVGIQVIAGTILAAQIDRTPPFHAFYGFVILIAAVLSHTARPAKLSRAITLMAAVCLFVGAVSIRGILVSSR